MQAQDDIALQLTEDAIMTGQDPLAQFALRAPAAAVGRAARLLENEGHTEQARLAIRLYRFRAFIWYS